MSSTKLETLDMSPKPDIRAIFCEALDRPTDTEVAQYLNAVCGDNSELRAQVEALLESHRKAGKFFLGGNHSHEPPTFEHAVTERVGSRVGRYKLLEQIGEGGMGVVFVAEQTEPIHRRVALKIVKPGMDTRQVIARFEAERQALAMMDHPNIAKIFDAGVTGARDEGGRMTDEGQLPNSSFSLHPSSFWSGRPYFVMELVRGMPITEYCDKARLDPRQRLALFITVCHAVQHAHQKGIIHRDLKPSNILVTLHDGTPVAKVIDFGVAKAISQRLTERTVYTALTQLIGTPLYMSPEQAELSGLDVDTRSDVYSLGVLLYELLTGSTPFDREMLAKAGLDEMRRLIREDEPLRPSRRISTLNAESLSTISRQRGVDERRMRQHLRGELDWIVMKTLEKDRNRRYESASALAADVQRYLNDESVQACPPSAAYRFRKFARKNKAKLTTIAMVFAALIVGTLVSLWQAVRATRAQVRADAHAAKAIDEQRKSQTEEQRARAAAEGERAATQAEAKARERANASERHAKEELYISEMRMGLADWNAGNIMRLSNKLFRHHPQIGDDEQRGWEWYYLLSLCLQSERTLMDHADQVTSVAWSPDGRFLASTSFDRTVRVYDMQSGLLIRTWTKKFTWVACWSPDSQFLAWVWPTSAGVEIGNVASGEIKTLGEHAVEARISWSRDGELLASGGNDHTIRVWRPVTGELIRVIAGIPQTVSSLAWHPAGKMLASAEKNSACISIWDVTSRVRLHQFVAGSHITGMYPCLSWSPDGKQLAVGSGDGKCRLYGTADWSVSSEWHAHSGNVTCVAWNRDGNCLASGGADHLIQLWDPEDGSSLSTLRGHLKPVKSIAWEPNGRRLASGGAEGLVKVWSLPAASQPHRLEGHRHRVEAIAWCKDGNTLRSFDANDGTITLWDVAHGQPLADLPVSPGKTAAFNAGASRLAIYVVADNHAKFLLHDSRSGEQIQTLTTNLNDVKSAECLCALSADGSKVALISHDPVELEIYDTHRGDVVFRYPDIWINSLSWSPDGRHLAAAGNAGDGNFSTGCVHVFDVENKLRIMKAPHGARALEYALAWSPDGQRLVSGDTDGELRIWEVPSGNNVLSIPLHTATVIALAWSPDGRRIASASKDGTVRVCDAIRGEELLKLEALIDDFGLLQWSPDGRRLAATAAAGAIYVWDASAGYEFVRSDEYSALRVHDHLDATTRLYDAGRKDEALTLCKQILEQHKEKLGILPRWAKGNINRLAQSEINARRYAEAIEWWRLILKLEPDDPAAHSRLARALAQQGETTDAIKSYREAIRLAPENATVLNNFSWLLATCPNPKFRDIHEAVELAKKANELQPDAMTSNTLGVALYRAGDWKAAIDALRKSENQEPEKYTSYNSFFLAMAHWQLNHKEDARNWYDKAANWMNQKMPKDEELVRFRAEAAELLGVKEASQPVGHAPPDGSAKTEPPSPSAQCGIRESLNLVDHAAWVAGNDSFVRTIDEPIEIFEHNSLGRVASTGSPRRESPERHSSHQHRSAVQTLEAPSVSWREQSLPHLSALHHTHLRKPPT